VYAFAQMQAAGGHAAPSRRRGGGAFKDLAAGMQYVGRDRIIRLLIVVNFMIVIVAMPYTMLLPGFVKEVLNKGALEQGLMVSLSGVGALVGSLIVASSSEHRRG